MKITSIKQQVKNTERVSVFVDGKYSFSLSLSEVVNEKIKNNIDLDEAELKRLKKLSADGKLKSRALEWLLNRPHSTREFQDYMRRKKAEPELTSQFAEEFLSRGYLDDAKYAAWLVDMRQRAGRSNRALRAELFKKGVAKDVIDETLENDAGNEEERLNELVAKKQKISRYQKDPQKLAQYLMRQGFNYAMVKQALSINTPED